MKCFHCGYCCTSLLATVIRDPDGPFDEDNLMVIGLSGEKERCPHLRGDKPGEYMCAVHDKEWYPRTPCAEYQSHWPDQPCRLGEFIVNKKHLNILQ